MKKLILVFVALLTLSTHANSEILQISFRPIAYSDGGDGNGMELPLTLRTPTFIYYLKFQDDETALLSSDQEFSGIRDNVYHGMLYKLKLKKIRLKNNKAIVIMKYDDSKSEPPLTPPHFSSNVSSILIFAKGNTNKQGSLKDLHGDITMLQMNSALYMKGTLHGKTVK